MKEGGDHDLQLACSLENQNGDFKSGSGAVYPIFSVCTGGPL